MDELTKIDLIRERLGVGYKEAKFALDMADGDVVQAIIFLEDSTNKDNQEFNKKGEVLLNQIKEIIKKGNVNKIRIVKDGRKIVEFPVNVGAIGIGFGILNPFLGLLGILGSAVALANNYKLEIERPNGDIEIHDIEIVEDDK